MVEGGIGIAHRERVVVRYCASRHRDGEKGQRSVLDKSAECVFGMGPPYTAAGDDDWPFGGTEEIHRGAGIRLAGGLCDGRDLTGGRRGAVEQIDGNGEMDGALSPCIDRKSTRLNSSHIPLSRM